MIAARHPESIRTLILSDKLTPHAFGLFYPVLKTHHHWRPASRRAWLLPCLNVFLSSLSKLDTANVHLS